MDKNSNTSFKKKGGGVVVLVRSLLSAELICHLYNDVEHLFVLVSNGTSEFIVGGVYLPPASSTEAFEAHDLAIEELPLLHPDVPMYICGNYNVPGAS
ncbi:hypothetical protein HHI36_013130 [Cryptolaemus montrouzieri]|uniref:Uncharacterized protein n=1 Tax=Cryptolaemus montrouzieri TaxID=559131 RepID=A0ABD2NG91_9CUCU